MTDLERISRQGGDLFQLALVGGEVFDCQQVVRRIPGRRIVCRGLWQGRSVYAKLFIGEEAERYAMRDARGVKALMASGIPTPELLHAGRIANGQGQVLLFAHLAHSRNLEETFETASPAEQNRLEDVLVRAVAVHHSAGLVQTDLYLRNFLLSHAIVYTLDGDGIRIRKTGVPRTEALDNLALLISKFDVAPDARLSEWLAVYTEVRGWHDAIPLEEMHDRVWAVRYRSARKNVLRKMLRECTDVHVEHDFHRYLAVVRNTCDDDLKHATNHPDAFLTATDSVRLKSGNTCTVGCVNVGKRRIVVKRYNIKSFWHGLGRIWRPSRASVSWANAHLLQSFKIHTPAPLALIERRWGPLRQEAWFMTAYVEGPDISEVLADPSKDCMLKQSIAVQVAELFHRLRLLGIEHGDMKAANMKWVNDEPLLLDLDAMKMHRFERQFLHRHARDLRRFLKNWHNAPDILRILKSALKQVYGSDPVLKRAGVDNEN